jgi:hypothetical protein
VWELVHVNRQLIVQGTFGDINLYWETVRKIWEWGKFQQRWCLMTRTTLYIELQWRCGTDCPELEYKSMQLITQTWHDRDQGGAGCELQLGQVWPLWVACRISDM